MSLDRLSEQFPAITLAFPGTGLEAAYERVRADTRLGPASLEVLLPALERAGPPEQRLKAFERGRLAAIGAYYAATARGESYLTDGERCSKRLGTGPHPALDAFDAVCVDLLGSWFHGLTGALVTREFPPAERIAMLEVLEALALDAVPWKPWLSQHLALTVRLARLEQV